MYLEMILDFERLIESKDHACVTIDEATRTVSLISRVKKMASSNGKSI